MAPVIVVLDMLKIHRLGDARQAVNVAGETPERRVIHDAPQIALEVAVIYGVEPHQGREQSDVGMVSDRDLTVRG
jgi:hypothetical protein